MASPKEATLRGRSIISLNYTSAEKNGVNKTANSENILKTGQYRVFSLSCNKKNKTKNYSVD